MSEMTKEQATYLDFYNHLFQERVRALVTPEVIDEHRRNPIGKHSDELERILVHLRVHGNQMKDKRMIMCTRPHQEWCIGTHSGVRGVPPTVNREECYPTRLAAEHGLFLRRLRDHDAISQEEFDRRTRELRETARS
jgi:hypothetical protein